MFFLIIYYFFVSHVKEHHPIIFKNAKIAFTPVCFPMKVHDFKSITSSLILESNLQRQSVLVSFMAFSATQTPTYICTKIQQENVTINCFFANITFPNQPSKGFKIVSPVNKKSITLRFPLTTRCETLQDSQEKERINELRKIPVFLY